MQRLGQHFLKDKSALKKIVRALDTDTCGVVIEIGAGHGELTHELVSHIQNTAHKARHTGIEIIAIEKDPRLVAGLKEKFKNNSRVKIVDGDVRRTLSLLVRGMRKKTYALVGNIPYYLTSYLFRIIGELAHKPSSAVFTIQKEVAERIVAQPPKMNKLAASVQFWSSPEIIARISRSAFLPPPKVDSAVVALKPRILSDKQKPITVNKNRGARTAKHYYEAVRALFAQPRKTVMNNLLYTLRTREDRGGNTTQITDKGAIGKKLASIGIDQRARPQNLSVEDIEAICEALF